MNHPPDINQYRPPKRHGGWIAVIIVTALVVALVIVARRVTTEPAHPVTPPPSPIATSASSTPTPIPASATAVASSLPFSSKDDDTEGRWSIDHVEWGPNTVTLTMTIAVTKGSLTDYTFFSMENQSTDFPQASQPHTGSLGTDVSQGHKVHGTITIDCPRTDATVMLTHGSGMASPISALMIRA